MTVASPVLPEFCLHCNATLSVDCWSIQTKGTHVLSSGNSASTCIRIELPWRAPKIGASKSLSQGQDTKMCGEFRSVTLTLVMSQNHRDISSSNILVVALEALKE